MLTTLNLRNNVKYLFIKSLKTMFGNQIFRKFIFLATIIEGPESRTGRALENAYKYCPSGNVTRQISKSEN